MVQSHLSPLNIHANFVNWVANRHSLNTSSNPLTQCTTHPLFTVLPSQNSAVGNASSSFFPVLLSALAHVFIYSYSVSGRRSSDLPAAFYTNRLPPYVKRRGPHGVRSTRSGVSTKGPGRLLTASAITRPLKPEALLSLTGVG